ncbi:ABC transporter ATP-binding protein [Nonomuraea rubra]|uniref:ABC-type nitrate/sulfonate/bicarbonate transport system ATPase subunit n=1 Tax=Nonomuraea rubra TaxID=46180 RepID=A0A7X0U594_9ACTN|nr:ABC transporter ATP-binding protein [Nonomuraea rubra]MBB6555613.1 ABC-type nitrate/sulfonate/bicarbonate transport system ATPase subunit [Nonomuraea rubra]
MLEIHDLRKVYESPGRRVEAIGSITLSVRAGELVCVVGPSGCGKTTLLRCVADSLRAVGLSDAADAHPWQLSGGMQQRVAIARAVAYEPQVLLMDEPFAAVDAQTRADLEDLILRLWRNFEITTLFVTHDIDEAVYLGRRVVVLSSSPTTVMEDLKIDLPAERDQLTTRSLPRFGELRGHVYRQIQRARGHSEDR